MAMKVRSTACSWIALMVPCCIAVSAPASAQEPVSSAGSSNQSNSAEPSAESGIGDIIVTAERREQSVQRSALTIQVLSGDDALRGGLSSPVDITKLTTGVEIGAGGGNSQIYIRGIGSHAFAPIHSPGVAFNVDGVYVGRPTAVGGNFYDIARIEVLKGPQGTLYGRNANGGSINLITNEPKLGARTLDLNLEAGNYAMIHASGAVNLPVGDDAAVRAAFNIKHRDGYLSNGTFDDVQQSGRIRFKWEPSSNISLLLNADYTHVGGIGSNATFLPQRPGSSPYEALAEPAAQIYKHSFPGAPLAFFTSTDRNDAYQDSNFYNLSAQLDWDLGFASLTVLPAYRRSETAYLSYDIAGEQEFIIDTDQTSLEVRLGKSSAELTWVIGGYYFKEVQKGTGTTINGDTIVPFLGRVLQKNAFTFNPSATSYAAFGQATLELLQGFRLIAGGRYTYEEQLGRGTNINTALTPPVLLATFDNRETFDGFTYKAGFEYDIGPNSMAYATYSTGFKAGGFNQTNALVERAYDPEKLDAIEIGLKNRFLDNRIQVNLSGYHWKYKGLQDSRVGIDSDGNVNFLTSNAGNAKIYGGTLDVIARLSDAGTLTFSGEYAHSEYEDFVINTPTFLYQPGSNGCAISVVGAITRQDCTGFQVARVPKWSATASYDHVFRLASGGNVTAGASLKYASARWLAINFTPAQRDGEYLIVDADLTYNSPDRKWSVGLFGRNLTKEIYYTGGIQPAFLPGLFAANIGAPRTYGVRASFKFGD